MSEIGFVKLQRSDATAELLAKYPSAFLLLTQIALRARFKDGTNLDGLEFGQAFVGDHDKCGLSRGKYRHSLAVLERLGLCRFKPINGKGAIATLLDSRVFSLRDERTGREFDDSNQRRDHHNTEEKAHFATSSAASSQPASRQQGATSSPAHNHHTASNQNGQKEENDEKDKKDQIAQNQPARAQTAVRAKIRSRDEVFDALASADGSDPVQLTTTAARAVGVALAEIRRVCPGLNAAEIERRAANYRLHMPDVTITATALAKHWARCDKPPTPRGNAHQQRVLTEEDHRRGFFSDN